MWRVVFIVMVLVTGCGDNPPVVYPTVAPFDEAKLALGPGDKIELVVYSGTRQTKASYTLDASGEIEVQYIGTVTALGKTAKQAQEEIQKRLADGFLIEPIVSLTITEINSQKLSVFGQVLRSGTIKFTPGMTIVEAIAQSGGFSPMARKNMVKVTRQHEGKTAIYKIPVEKIAEGSRPNFPLMPGDQVFVPERAW
jgi:protein involved in polysaccharide export with SLBB domain